MDTNEIELRNAMGAEARSVAVAAFGELSFLWRSADDLNLRESEDRAIFRMRVADRLKLTTVEAMRGWVPNAPRDRDGAMRAVADAYIAIATA